MNIKDYHEWIKQQEQIIVVGMFCKDLNKQHKVFEELMNITLVVR